MQFRQQRRRRVWSDDLSTAEMALESSSGETIQARSVETYTLQARREQQPHLTDLIPIRYRTLFALYLLGLLVSAVFEVFYLRSEVLARYLPFEALSACDLAERGSFAAWWSSFLLCCGALTAALTYSLRRHRIDDYRGRYRVWIGVTLLWLLLAVNQTSHLDDLLRAGIEQTAAHANLTWPGIWSATCIGLSLLVIVRLSFEMWPSVGAVVCLALGAGAWFVAAEPAKVGISLDDSRAEVMLACGLRIFGQLTLLASQVAYARYVLLDAHGQIPLRQGKSSNKPAKRKRKATPEPETAKSEVATKALAQVNAGHSKPTPQRSGLTTPVAKSTGNSIQPTVRLAEDDEDDSDDESERGLSRAERKRTRRERRDQRRNQAA